MSARGGSLSEEEVDMDEDDDLEDETEEERGGSFIISILPFSYMIVRPAL